MTHLLTIHPLDTAVGHSIRPVRTTSTITERRPL